MKNIIGVPAVKENFFPRDREVEKIYRSLENGNNIYLSAPRRVGKSSIMNFLKDNPRKGFQFVLGNYESCRTADEFFGKLISEIYKSPDILNRAKRLTKKAKEVFDRFASLNFEGLGVKLEANAKKEVDLRQTLTDLLEALKSDGTKLVIMIDEFPEVIINIHEHQSQAEAANFLHQHRQLRQEICTDQRVSFIYTGSVSMHHIVAKVADPKTINDFDIVTVDPLSQKEAKQMAELLLAEHAIKLRPAQVNELIDGIHWYIPYHIQLLIKEILKLHHDEPDTESQNWVSKAFESLLGKHNKPQFDHYFNRLPKIYHDGEREFVMKALQAAAGEVAPNYSQLADIANLCGCLPRCAEILEALEVDGYIVENHPANNYIFRSPILQAWWNRHERKKYQ
ncbi:MAG: ATP-binding protein [Bacteroidia bacterium]